MDAKENGGSMTIYAEEEGQSPTILRSNFHSNGEIHRPIIHRSPSTSKARSSSQPSSAQTSTSDDEILRPIAQSAIIL
ncbi:hypothetical protein IEQ34_019379 [Dendrobium chrysotoxum]|uniref:Uncharacterized protein n=1 Tax=Dendrobium chrysotoxum TaxID=161865 RepID=A0AAV7G7M0_DENCH|nr:hypothetical protein IEQ34_019379 [Dendrobium chrysotoxum]